MFSWYILFFIGILAVVKADVCISALQNVKLKALIGGGVHVYLHDSPEIYSFIFNGNINKPIKINDHGEMHGEQRIRRNGVWELKFRNILKIGDVINYWIVVLFQQTACYTGNRTWSVKELQNSTSSQNSSCSNSITVINGFESVCQNKLIFNDNFNELLLNTKKWIVEQRISTYDGPVYEFNWYENHRSTLYISNDKLYLKPVALTTESEVRGVLDLRQGCTSKIEDECYYVQKASFLVPPVRSSRIKSKFSFKYGKIEIVAKLPFGDWIFPMVQLEQMQAEANETVIWVAYCRGNDYLWGTGNDEIGSRLLFAGPVIYPREPQRSKMLVTKRSQHPYSDDFHNYTMIWEPGNMTFFIDSEKYGTVAIGGFDEERVISLGVAVGGFNDFPDDYTSSRYPKPWENGERNSVKKFFDSRNVWLKTWKDDNVALLIDSVKVWSL